MPRGSGGRSAPRPAQRAAPVRNPPQPAQRAPPPAPTQSSGGSILGSIGATIADGMAFGTGSGMAHRVVDAMIGPRTVHYEITEAPAVAAPVSNAVGSDSCNIHSKAFQDCINHYGSDISKCQFYLDMLNECRRGAGASA